MNSVVNSVVSSVADSVVNSIVNLVVSSVMNSVVSSVVNSVMNCQLHCQASAPRSFIAAIRRAASDGYPDGHQLSARCSAFNLKWFIEYRNGDRYKDLGLEKDLGISFKFSPSSNLVLIQFRFNLISVESGTLSDSMIITNGHTVRVTNHSTVDSAHTKRSKDIERHTPVAKMAKQIWSFLIELIKLNEIIRFHDDSSDSDASNRRMPNTHRSAHIEPHTSLIAPIRAGRCRSLSPLTLQPQSGDCIRLHSKENTKLLKLLINSMKNPFYRAH